jgi:hypothetical protein
MPGVVGHGWAAHGGPGGAAAQRVVADRGLARAARAFRATPCWHCTLLFAPYGFIGMLSLGLSYVLVPMFVLSDTADEKLAAGIAGCWRLRLCCWRRWRRSAWRPGRCLTLAIVLGIGAVALHLWLMRQALRAGMRRLSGPSWLLVRLGWAGLVISLVLALALLAQLPVPRLGLWFGLCLIGVWQLSFLLGMLQRIAPFLAAMHGGSGRRARTPSALTHDGALRLHLVCHNTALGLLALAIAIDSAWPTLAAAVVGSTGALAYGVFYVTLTRRMRVPDAIDTKTAR